MTAPTVDRERLAGLFRPRSVALIGASDKSYWSSSVFDSFQRFEYPGALYAVNRNGNPAHGLPGFRSCREIPNPVDLAMIYVPAPAVIDALRDAAAAGVRNAVVLSSGFAEAGAEGAKLQNALVEEAQALGVLMIGPNSLGFANISERLIATQLAYRKPMRVGGMALVSQSGAVANEMAKFAHQQGYGLSFLGATGNEGMLSIADMIDYLIDDPATRVIAAYLESVRDAGRFRALAERALAARKALVVVKVGSSALSAAVAKAHTGAFVGDDRVFDAFCRQYGVCRTRSIDELIVTAAVIERAGVLERPGVALASVSGGACGQFADLAAIHGVPLPELAPETAARLRAGLPAFASPMNPLDVTGVVLQDESLWAKALHPLFDDPSIGLVLALMNIPGAENEIALSRIHWKAIGEAYRAAGREPFLISQVMQPFDSWAQDASEISGVKNIAFGLEMSTRALGHLTRWSARVKEQGRSLAQLGGRQICPMPRGESGAIEHLARHGVPVIPSELVQSREAAVQAARRFAGKVALKIASPDIAHKTEVGGVRLGLSGESEVADAFDAILASVKTHAPKAKIDGVLVSPMRDQGVELFVGTARDDDWGPVIVVGLGGVWTEILNDAALRLLPIDKAEARAMLDELRGVKILKGYRGAAPADLDKLAAAIVAASEAALALGPDLASLEINPLLVDGAIIEALDALAV